MLGKCPRPFLRKVVSKNHLTQRHEDETPVLQPPHQIVIGFDLGTDSGKSLHTQACESPRSVLESHHLCLRAHLDKSRSPCSPLSALGSSLSDHHRKARGAALCHKVSIKAEDDGYHTLLKREHVACDVDGASVHNAGAGAACKCDCVRTLQNQQWNSRGQRRDTVCRRGRVKPHGKTFLSCNREDDSGSSDDEDDDEDIVVDSRVSIFSTASPVSNNSMFDLPASDFLSKCFLCRSRLPLQKDIYMYRGDQAFCSQECRYQQIVVDESKERGPSVATCFSGASSQHRSVRRATQAAVA